MALNAGDWVEIGEVFKDSLEHVLRNTQALEEKSRARIQHYVYHSALYDNPYMLLTMAGVKNAVETVFSDEVVRDFVLRLSFVFFSRWGTSDEKYGQLIDTLAFAVSADVPTGFSGTQLVPCAIPSQVLADMPKSELARSTLYTNKWLSIVLLLQLVIQMPEQAVPKRPPKQQQTSSV